LVGSEQLRFKVVLVVASVRDFAEELIKGLGRESASELVRELVRGLVRARESVRE